MALGLLVAGCEETKLAALPPVRPPTPVPLLEPGRPPTPAPAFAVIGGPARSSPQGTSTDEVSPTAVPPTPTVTPKPTPTATPKPTPSPTPTLTPTPLAQLNFSEIRVAGSSPSQVQIGFSLRDELGHSLVIPSEELESATRIFEIGPRIQGDGELDYDETNFFIHTAENFQLEIVFVLDFTNSMAIRRLPDGSTGVEAMVGAFERAVGALPGAHRIGVVEFHDRSVEPGILSEITTDRDAVLESVAQFVESQFEPGSSRVWDSIQTAADLFTRREDNPDVVRSLIFISDGRDTSSVYDRGDAGETATEEEIQLYALGVGDVFEEEQLEGVVQDTGGSYYPTGDLVLLQDQLRAVVNDLRGQYRLNYVTLRRDGVYQARIQVNLPGATGTFVTPQFDVSLFYAPDIRGLIGIDPPSLEKIRGEAQVFIRALHVPRNIRGFRFKVETTKTVEASLVPELDGGLLEGWNFSGPDLEGYYEASSDQPLEFGEIGLLFQLTLSGVTEKSLEVPIIFDNSLYASGQSLSHPEVFYIGERIPPGGRIAFRSDRDGSAEIYVMNFDGSEQANLTNHRHQDFLPTWSPDGKQIAFDSDRDFARAIYVMNDDGTNVRQLTSISFNNLLPAWSTDGLKIAFDSDRDGNREIYTMNADGTNQIRLTNELSNDWWATWSPDGSRVAFTSN